MKGMDWGLLFACSAQSPLPVYAVSNGILKIVCLLLSLQSQRSADSFLSAFPRAMLNTQVCVLSLNPTELGCLSVHAQ